ncbi:hypothetical protein Vadar_000216 [Vaccinium darrowii]|uniref:Uncharacterized protein n=1 Tax=Vaccinium darrowii TaxID=229202 RepID=A0ACB7YS04_9ERIC|nr:hypothetical protein Vadar_000216 [Vaccinium darrowii]
MRYVGEPKFELLVQKGEKTLCTSSRGNRERGQGNEKVIEIIKSALAKVLVPYYPLAGGLTFSQEGRLVVDCTGEGAVFVEAAANWRIEDIEIAQRLIL